MATDEVLDSLRNELETVREMQQDSTGWCTVGGGEPKILRPVLRGTGQLQWCCTHSEEHCSPVIGG